MDAGPGPDAEQALGEQRGEGEPVGGEIVRRRRNELLRVPAGEARIEEALGEGEAGKIRELKAVRVDEKWGELRAALVRHQDVQVVEVADQDALRVERRERR